MPNRILRDWTASEKIHSLSIYGERFFTRLIMKADDYGCFYSDSRLLRANLFPLFDNIREADLLRWIAECVKAGLITLYENAGKRYLQINDFRQRLDKAKSKFPLPTDTDSITTDNDSKAETETEVEAEVETESEKKQNPPAKKKSRVFGLLKDEFLKKANSDYYFEGKDGSALKAIEHKLTTLLKTKKDYQGGEPTEEEILLAWKFILEKMPSAWVKENFTLCNINGQWNVIIEQLKNGHNGKPTSKSKQQLASEHTDDQRLRVMEGSL